MALEAIVDSLDGINDAFKSEYKQVADGPNAGKYVLDVSPVGGYALDNLDGLKSALGATKTELDKANSALSGYNGLKMKPSDIASKLKRLGELEALDPDSEADKRAQAKLQGFQTQITAEFEGKLSTEKSRGDRYKGQVEKLLVTNALQEAITKHGGVSALLTPVLSNRVKVTEDADGNLTTQVLDETGNQDMTIRDGKVVASTIEDLVQKFKADPTFGRAFEASGKAGSGAPPKGTGAPPTAGQTVYSLAEWQDKTSRATPEERQKLFQDLSAKRIVVNTK